MIGVWLDVEICNFYLLYYLGDVRCEIKLFNFKLEKNSKCSGTYPKASKAGLHVNHCRERTLFSITADIF